MTCYELFPTYIYHCVVSSKVFDDDIVKMPSITCGQGEISGLHGNLVTSFMLMSLYLSGKGAGGISEKGMDKMLLSLFRKSLHYSLERSKLRLHMLKTEMSLILT